MRSPSQSSNLPTLYFLICLTVGEATRHGLARWEARPLEYRELVARWTKPVPPTGN